MDVEVIIGVAAVFASGTGLGVGATLFTQWVHRKLTWPPPSQPQIPQAEIFALKGDVEDLTRAVVNLNERVEFQERLAATNAGRRSIGTPASAATSSTLRRPCGNRPIAGDEDASSDQ